MRTPSQSQFNPKDVEETAEWAKATTIDLERDQDNAFRSEHRVKGANEELRRHVRQEVEWQFTVDSIGADRVNFDCTWSTVGRWCYPNIPEVYGSLAGKLIVTPRFSVGFRRVPKDPVERVFEAGGHGNSCLRIGEEISQNLALRLKPKDILKIKGKIESLDISFPGALCLNCVLIDITAQE